MNRWNRIGGACAVLSILLSSCSGGGGEAESPFSYQAPVTACRAGESLEENAPLSAGPAAAVYSVDPALPDGLVLDEKSGAIRGVPLLQAAGAEYVVTRESASASVVATVWITVGPELPAAIDFLEAGFAAEVVAANVNVPVRMALAPDGRLFFNELESGDVQVIGPDGSWLPAPLVTVPIEAGFHKGLLGLALDPEFETNGHLYVMAVTPAGGEGPLRTRVLRYTESLGGAIDQTVIVDDLPVTDINNGGELLFDAAGNLLVSVGDTLDPDLAQEESSLAGKLLRYTPTGAVPADNPDPASPVWCLGLRNTFGLALHPGTGGLFGADNGPDRDDELVFFQPGKNYGWGDVTGELGNEAGFTVRTWTDVITPTALVFHPGGAGWEGVAGQLFLSAYSAEDVRRLRLTGEAFTDYQEETVFLHFRPDGFANKPLDLVVAEDGSLYVSTFTGIYRVWAMFVSKT